MTTLAEDNITAWLKRATPEQHSEGLKWYSKAHHWCRDLADESGIDFLRVVKILAALSPRTPWPRNLLDARACTLAIKPWNYVTYPANVQKAQKIRAGDVTVLSGPKVLSFAACIVDPTDKHSVCVDRHAARVAGVMDIRTITAKKYNDIAAAYRQVASQQNLLPQQVQAIT